jgi:cell division protein FtsB
MSSPAAQLRSRMPRISPLIGGAAVERARLRVVPRRAPQHTRVPFVALVSLLLLGGVVGLLLFNTSMQQAAFAATALEGQAGTLAARQQTLEMEIDVLRDPQRVAERAQSMGMVPGGTPAYIQLPSGKVLGEPSPATAQDGLRLLPRPEPKPAILDPDPIVRQVIGDGPTAASLGGSAGGGPDLEGRPTTRTRD